MRRFTIPIMVSVQLCLGMAAMAQEEPRPQEAHVHGHGRLNIAIEGKMVVMELEVPGMDIVGFEHEPRTDAQKAAMKGAKAGLHDEALSLFVLPKQAKCILISSKVGIPGHRHESEENKLKKHDEHKGAGHEEGKEHSEFHAKYQLECGAPENLTGISFAFFKRFPNARELKVAVVGEHSQSVHEVTRKNPVLEGLLK